MVPGVRRSFRPIHLYNHHLPHLSANKFSNRRLPLLTNIMKIIKSILLLAGLAGFVNGQYRKDTLKLTSINGRPCDTALVEDWEPSGDKDSWMIRPCGVNACDVSQPEPNNAGNPTP